MTYTNVSYTYVHSDVSIPLVGPGHDIATRYRLVIQGLELLWGKKFYFSYTS
jgi:hypothetical protein